MELQACSAACRSQSLSGLKQSLAASAQSAWLSYRALSVCVCVCLEQSEVFYCTLTVCEITFV